MNNSMVDEFVNAYVECALWSCICYGDLDENAGTFLDENYEPDDIAEEAMESMRADCIDFIEGAGSLLDNIDAGQAGHDFWLTRNHHGAGFWDRGLGEVGDELTKLAHPYGESDLYVGDDGKVYVS